jgi:hypothetical protein
LSPAARGKRRQGEKGPSISWLVYYGRCFSKPNSSSLAQ